MKTNKRLFLLIPMVALFAGCAQLPKASNSNYKDTEPVIVGKSIAQIIVDNTKEIKDQLKLLNRTKYGIQTGEHVGNYAAVNNTNDLDARKNERNTIPNKLANSNYQIETKIGEKANQVEQNNKPTSINTSSNIQSVATSSTTQTEVKPVSVPEVKTVQENDILIMKTFSNDFYRKVAEINWENKSLNELGRKFASAVGYEFAVQKGQNNIEDYDVSYKATNKTIKDALIDLAKTNQSKVKIVLNPQVKMLTFVYK